MLLESNDYRQFLNEELVRKIKINPRYSLRAFARQIGLSPGELSEILRQKRSLSVKGALKIAVHLQLTEAEKDHLLSLIQKEKANAAALRVGLTIDEAAPTQRQLTMDLFHVVSDWYCFAILNLAETAGFKWNEDWIAKRLGISVPEVKTAIQRLTRAGLIEFNKGSAQVTKDYVISPEGIPSEAIRTFHHSMLVKAREALESQSVEERDITGLTIAIDPKKLSSIKKEINEFLDRINARYARGPKTEVYQLELALFRLTREGR